MYYSSHSLKQRDREKRLVSKDPVQGRKGDEVKHRSCPYSLGKVNLEWQNLVHIFLSQCGNLDLSYCYLAMALETSVEYQVCISLTKCYV